MLSKQHSTILPIMALLLSASFWGILWYPLRYLEENGLAGLWSTFLIFVSALCVGIIVVLRRRHPVHNASLLLMLALASGWCNTAFILAVLDGNVVRVVLLFYLSPVWTVVLGWFMLGEALSRSSKITLILAMTGALIMLWDKEIGLPWPKGYTDWMALSSGFAFALSNVIVRRLQNVPVWEKSTASWFGVVLFSGLWLVLSASPLPDADFNIVISAVILGAIGMVIVSLALYYGVTHIPAHRSATVLLFELVAAAVSAQILTDEVVLLKEMIGGSFIIAAAWYVAHSHIKEVNNQETNP